MQKIQYIKNYRDKKSGEIETVGNNIAFGLIDLKVAILYKDRMFRSPGDKMMRAKEPETKIETRTETRAERRTRIRTEKLKNQYKTK